MPCECSTVEQFRPLALGALFRDTTTTIPSGTFEPNIFGFLMHKEALDLIGPYTRSLFLFLHPLSDFNLNTQINHTTQPLPLFHPLSQIQLLMVFSGL